MPDPDQYVLSLYVAGGAPRSRGAIAVMEEVVRRHSGWRLELIDVTELPAVAERERVLATPTVVRKRPQGELRLVGGLADADTVASLLDLDTDGGTE